MTTGTTIKLVSAPQRPVRAGTAVRQPHSPLPLDISSYVHFLGRYIGLALAVSSSLAIGTSFVRYVLSKNEPNTNKIHSQTLFLSKGLMDAADRVSGPSTDTHTYLKNPIWWAGMMTMHTALVLICHSFFLFHQLPVANFAAYTFAPPILVTPLGALSVLIGAVLASFFLKEKLGRIGKIGCALCLLGSIIIVLHAPEDKEVKTVDEILGYAMHPGFMFYCFFVLVFSLVMIYKVSPIYGTREPIVYISICSLVGSVSVMAIKGFGVAVKLTLAGSNQLTHLPTYVFAIVVAGCIVVQMNYFNKALDQFSTNVYVVNPIYYVCFSTATIVSSLILFQGFGTQDAVNTLSLLMGFFVTFLGVYLLNISRLDPTGTAQNEDRSLESGVMHPRMSLNASRLSMSSEQPLTHHPIHRSYHRSTMHSSANPFNSAYRSQDSVLFEAFPEESVGLTLMNTSEEEEDDESHSGHHPHHFSSRKNFPSSNRTSSTFPIASLKDPKPDCSPTRITASDDQLTALDIDINPPPSTDDQSPHS
ncbi:hypothetical protein VP01_208g4 [Puccinia sorghi]|uniref:DUF803-domain-containing protein n=1 Tax=Puccinia sorghi TaxID=27349 RepID=A0A0L6VAW6_9BASI|nr:hypothetical protein VP01_208g4 [Puccinia sorghi]